MDWLANVLTSTNAIPVMIFVIGTIIIVCVLGKHGYLNIHTDKISIGASEKERFIIRQQIEYSETACMSFLQRMPKIDNFNEYIGKYIVERIYDEFVKMISFNHITDSEAYIQIKQALIWNIITTITKDPYYKSDEFKDMVFLNVKEAIEQLVKIRKHYSK